jgi:hypothetical protein
MGAQPERQREVREVESWWEGVGDGALSPGQDRLVGLVAEFRRRQRVRPDLVVRPWWAAPGRPGEAPRLGFVLEYCPGGRESVEIVVRGERVTVEGPSGTVEAVLDLSAGWRLDGCETGSPETLANHLLRLADRALGEAA